MTGKTHNIVIIGGSFAGIGIGHSLLKNIIPRLQADRQSLIKVTLIAPSSEYLFTLAGLRALVEPELIDGNQLYHDFLPHFDQYRVKDKPNSGLHFVRGYVTSLDEVTKTLAVRLTDSGEETVMDYDSVIIATGARTATPELKLKDQSADQAKKAHKALAAKVAAANHIAIGGAGPVGVELSTDIREIFPDKKVTVYAGSRGVMSKVQPRFAKEAEERLKNEFKIDVVSGVRVKSAEPTKNAAGEDRVLLTLTDGTTNAEADLYIPASGETPNTEFLPSTYLDSSGYLDTTPQLRVRNTKSTNARVYGLGDVTASSGGVVHDYFFQAQVLKEILLQELALDELPAEPIMTTPSGKPLAYEPQDPLAKNFVVTLGSRGGIAMTKGWRLPSWLVGWLRARDMSLSKSIMIASGKMAA
ncbi:hypothetical protein DV452_000692 [Geotrichum candidum]|uniref:FAD/NAD(P)-binding domain-containing protein n=1 Tax=Geotrichum candidum TaxID=1173061 RepID=A0A0J9XAZ2_GEOCN|nr:hypothetical protein DV454_000149 [Geotrichum candidum]KAF5121622.1 hypothetical protein DV452_000692 [Geotrichum candidum]KAI8134764.1 hypothetical protein DUD61_001549 [Geotrichum candidum]KAI9212209.1 hypothetical protein DS838_002911 [Geotrichum bryndzae]CDO53998.1 Conserved hypothetical protein. Putative FAD-dependent pyridine nucleotide-disulphide oxidoreductase [Geotrichum candidum]